MPPQTVTRGGEVAGGAGGRVAEWTSELKCEVRPRPEVGTAAQTARGLAREKAGRQARMAWGTPASGARELPRPQLALCLDPPFTRHPSGAVGASQLGLNPDYVHPQRPPPALVLATLPDPRTYPGTHSPSSPSPSFPPLICSLPPKRPQPRLLAEAVGRPPAKGCLPVPKQPR